VSGTAQKQSTRGHTRQQMSAQRCRGDMDPRREKCSSAPRRGLLVMLLLLLLLGLLSLSLSLSFSLCISLLLRILRGGGPSFACSAFREEEEEEEEEEEDVYTW
jgi:hypothetical protein